MKRNNFRKKFWETYRLCSLYLLFPAICMFVCSLLFYWMDAEPERFDRQTQGVVVSCVDQTNRSRSAMENGGPTLSFLIEAEYQVDGVTYTCKEHWGSPRQVGSIVTITYNSAKPSDSTLIPDPVAGNLRLRNLVVGSGITLFLCVVPLVMRKKPSPKRQREA